MTQTPLFWTCIAFVFGAHVDNGLLRNQAKPNGNRALDQHVQVDVRRQDQLTMFEYLTRTIVVAAAR